MTSGLALLSFVRLDQDSTAPGRNARSKRYPGAGRLAIQGAKADQVLHQSSRRTLVRQLKQFGLLASVVWGEEPSQLRKPFDRNIAQFLGLKFVEAATVNPALP